MRNKLKQDKNMEVNVKPKFKRVLSSVPLRSKIIYGSVLLAGIIGASVSLAIVPPGQEYQPRVTFSGDIWQKNVNDRAEIEYIHSEMSADWETHPTADDKTHLKEAEEIYASWEKRNKNYFPDDHLNIMIDKDGRPILQEFKDIY